MVLGNHVIRVGGDGAVGECIVIGIAARKCCKAFCPHASATASWSACGKPWRDAAFAGRTVGLGQRASYIARKRCRRCRLAPCISATALQDAVALLALPAPAKKPASHHGVQDREIALPWHASLNQRVGVDADDPADAWRARYLRTRSGT
jgi:hypothetical protein